jgi:hypothetical protein
VTAAGQKILYAQRRSWADFVDGVHRILEPENA